jgi:hypothetical protein
MRGKEQGVEPKQVRMTESTMEAAFGMNVTFRSGERPMFSRMCDAAARSPSETM